MSNKLNVILFFVVMMGGMIAFFVLPTQKISHTEKRKLATVPSLNWNSYVNGKWADSVDQYVNDHFPFRNDLIGMASVVRYARGIHFKGQEKVFVVQKPKKRIRNKKDLAAAGDTSMNYLDDFDEAYSGSLLIINGSVYPMGGGSPAMGKPFAKMVNEYAENLKGHTRVFSAVAPLSSAFIPAEKYRHYNGQNKRTLEAIRNNLSNGAIFCDVFDELNNHSNEKMFFSTDHHWNAKGAYYAYVSFCKAAGFDPVPMDKMQKKIKYKFLGTLYEKTRDQTVKQNADTFEYYVPNVRSTAIRYGEYGFTGYKSNTFCHGSSGGYCYSTFLCGDHPLLKINTDVKNGRKCVVIKNSMGNAFSVYLISHYEEIWVVDFRYSRQNLTDLINNNDIDDMIFAVGMYAAMSNGTINMMRRLATQKGGAPQPVVEKQDSSAVLPDDKLLKDTLK